MLDADLHACRSPTSSCPLFFFNDPATTEIYTLSLHDALPISPRLHSQGHCAIAEAAERRPARSRDDQPRRAWRDADELRDRKSTRLNSSHVEISYAVFCLKKKKRKRKSNEHTRCESHVSRKQK